MAGGRVQVRENGRIGCQARIVKLRVLDPEDPSKELAAIRAKVGRRKADACWHGKHMRQAKNTGLTVLRSALLTLAAYCDPWSLRAAGHLPHPCIVQRCR